MDNTCSHRKEPFILQYKVFLFALANLLCYIPLSMMTKMSSKGLFTTLGGYGVTSFEMMPLFVIGTTIITAIFFTLSGWWKYIAKVRIWKFEIPVPRIYTFFSGLCIVGQIFTVIWLYAFKGISIVFAALLMKGGVIILAPIVDSVLKNKRRKIFWPSWIAAVLSLCAMIIAFIEKGDTALTLVCLLDIAIYLTAYFVKLTIISLWSKDSHATNKKRFIAEEQLSMLICMIIIIFIGVIIGSGSTDGIFREMWRGVFVLPAKGFIVEPILIGMAGFCAGVFASVVFLDRRENTFCVTMIQSSSIIAGTIATILLALLYNQPFPGIYKMISVLIVLLAIVTLTTHRKAEQRSL